MSSSFKDLTGEKHGRLAVLRIAGKKNGNYTWMCQCDCGNQVEVRGSPLAKGHTTSCGCAKREAVTTHGMRGTRTYFSWQGMKSRCYRETDPFYADYGGRGIRVCERWMNSFENFLADMGERPIRQTLDRIDNHGNYEPGNCRWSTPKVQNRNSRNNHILTIRSEKMCVMEWSERSGIDHRVIYNRLRLGWPAKRAVFETPRRRTRKTKIKTP